MTLRRCGWMTGLVCLLTLAFSVRPAAAADMTGGVEVGANFTTVGLGGTEASGAHSDIRGGVLFGVFAQLPITDSVSIQPELVYSQKHFKISAPGFRANEDLEVMELPVLLRATVVKPDRNPGFYVVMGPSFGYRVRARETKRIENGKPQPDGDNSAGFNTARWNVIGGAGITKGKWDVEGRYEAGLRNLIRENSGEGDLTVRERSFSVLFRWRFK